MPQPGPPGHRHPSPPLIPCGQPGGQPCQASAPVSQGFGSGVPAHAHAANWAIYTSDLLTAESQFQQKYGYIPNDLTACTAGPDGGAPACGGKDLLDVLTFLSGYLCIQPGIACTGPAASQSPLQAAISLGGGMILGAGRDGGIVGIGKVGERGTLFDPSTYRASPGSEDDTFLYQKLSSTGEHLKYGITKNPETRYTSAELNGGWLNILASGSRQDMLALERSLHETLPIGPEEGQTSYIGIQVARGLRPPPY